MLLGPCRYVVDPLGKVIWVDLMGKSHYENTRSETCQRNQRILRLSYCHGIRGIHVEGLFVLAVQ